MLKLIMNITEVVILIKVQNYLSKGHARKWGGWFQFVLGLI